MKLETASLKELIAEMPQEGEGTNYFAIKKTVNGYSAWYGDFDTTDPDPRKAVANLYLILVKEGIIK